MLSNDDHPGVFTFLVGLIIVVMVGVGLSLLVDRRFSFSRSASSLESGLKEDGTELEYLKNCLQQSSRKLAEIEPKRRTMAEASEAVRRQNENLDQRRVTLTASRDELRRSIPAIEEEFLRYRGKYRDATWAAAVGQSLGNLTVRSGREYRQVVITRVTDVGLEIRHENGIARVQAPDLDPALQDRFQWDDEERRARLKEESILHDSMARAADSKEVNQSETAGPRGFARETPGPDSEKPEVLRDRVRAWKSRVAQLGSERSRAMSSAYGTQTSVPGSLETWQAKSARLGENLSKARSELAVAKAALAAVAPDDPLLRSDADRD